MCDATNAKLLYAHPDFLLESKRASVNAHTTLLADIQVERRRNERDREASEQVRRELGAEDSGPVVLERQVLQRANKNQTAPLHT